MSINKPGKDELEPSENTDKLSLLVIGQVGSGKSTLLSLITRIYFKHCSGAKDDQPIKFISSKSATSVTTKVNIEDLGNLLIMDTPGTSDPNKKRTDRQIFNEVVNTVRTTLSSQSQGLTTVIQCIMPDSGGRIKRQDIEASSAILLSLTSMYKETNPSNHPKMVIVFTNVSKRIEEKSEPPE